MTEAELDEALTATPRLLDFSMRNLNHQAICYEDLRGADFRGSLLVKAELSGSRLDSARFDSADLLRAELFQSSCVGTSFRGARLAGAGLSEVDLTSADFEACDLEQVHFNGSRFSSLTRFLGASGTPLEADFIIVDGRRLEGDDANRWLRERIAPTKAEQAA